MQKKHTKSIETQHKRLLGLRDLWGDFVTGSISISVTLFAVLLSSQVSEAIYPTKYSPVPNADLPLIARNLSYLAGGIVLLGIIIVGISNFMKHKNRGTILLKQRLTEIYLSALRESALNPRLESPRLESSTSHD